MQFFVSKYCTTTSLNLFHSYCRMKDIPYIANISLLCDYLRRPAPYYNPVAAGDASVG